MSRRVESVAVVGRDAPLWLAAAALQRALGRTGLRVHAVELESRLAEVDVYRGGADARLDASSARPRRAPGARSLPRRSDGRPAFLQLGEERTALPAQPMTTNRRADELAVRSILDEGHAGGVARRVRRLLPGKRVRAAERGSGPGRRARAVVRKLWLSPATHPPMRSLQSSLPCGWASKSRLRVCAVWRHRGDRIEGIDLADGTRIDADLYIDASGGDAALSEPTCQRKIRILERVAAVRPHACGERPAPAAAAGVQPDFRLSRRLGRASSRCRTEPPLPPSTISAAIGDSEVVELAGVIARISNHRRRDRQRAAAGHAGVAVDRQLRSHRRSGDLRVDPIDAVELHVDPRLHLAPDDVVPGDGGRIPGSRCVQRGGPRLRRATCATSRPRIICSTGAMMSRCGIEVRETQRRRRASSARSTCSARARSFRWATKNRSRSRAGQRLLLGCGVVPQGYDPRVDSMPDAVHVQQVQQRLRDVAALARQMPVVEQFLGLEQRSPALVGG